MLDTSPRTNRGRLTHGLLWLLFAFPLYGQQLQPVVSQQADCGKFVQPAITTAGTFTSQNIDNRFAACDGFVVTYSSNGFATVSVLLQDAPLGVGGIAGTFVSFAGTIVAPFTNPTTATTQGKIQATGYFPYVRIQITTTGTGYLVAEIHGFKTNPNSGSGAAGGGCAGTSATPCVVDGPTAAGSPPTTAPVLVAGQDGSPGNIQTLRNTANGLFVQGPAASGATILGNPVIVGGGTNGGSNLHALGLDGFGGLLIGSTIDPGDGVADGAISIFESSTGGNLFDAAIPYLFNGTTWDRGRGGASTDGANGIANTGVQKQQIFAFGGTTGQVAPLGTALSTADGNNGLRNLMVAPWQFNGASWDRQFVCTNQVFVNLAASGNAQVIAASGSTSVRICHMHLSTTAPETLQITTGTGVNCAVANAVIDSYQSTSAFTFDGGPSAALRGGASNAVCVNPSANTTLTGVIIYAQF